MSTSDESVLSPSFAEPVLSLRLVHVKWQAWKYFAPHHYLTAAIHKSAHCFLVVLDDGTPVAFTAYMRLPHGTVKNAWRGHRTVVLPDFQGLGIGPRISALVGEMIRADGGRYYSRTTHPRLIAYRDASPLWRLSSRRPAGATSGKSTLVAGGGGQWNPDLVRHSVSHEYIGRVTTQG